MNDWMKQYPNTVVTRLVKGDPNYASQFRGDADNLLYQLKTLMRFNNLGRLDMKRIFTDGTVIIAKSVFGHDTVEIDVSEITTGVAGAVRCIITLINLPDAVQPMQYPTEIHDGEIEGVDYIKTYYLVDITGCIECQDIEMEFLFDYLIPPESRHYDDEPDNHCVYSLNPPCWGVVISHGHDSQGDYFIWKAFTETGSYSRTGLGVLDLNAEIRNPGGDIICFTDKQIDVDCCLKNADLRAVAIWWESCGVGVDICELGAEFSYKDLVNYTIDGGILYTRPEEKGGCIPFEWSITGPGSISTIGEFKDRASYVLPATGSAGCNDPLYISVQDRCNTLYVSHATPCCDSTPDPLEIYYTSLQMSCSQSQDFTAIGGCLPYSWSLSGGGGTLVVTSWNTARYTAPATNPSCVNNPTITVTDCCGMSASVQLAVNCYTANDPALKYDDANQTACAWDYRGCYWQGSAYYKDWNCAGVEIYYYPYAVDIPVFNSAGDCTSWTSQANCNSECGKGPKGRCPHSPRGLPGWLLTDFRNQAMLDAGCCPLNPFTGLPY